MDKIFDCCYKYGLRANHITLSRLFFATIVAVFGVIGFSTLAFVAIAIMWYTDRLDGAFARGRDETSIGKLLDRLVDKAVLDFILGLAFVLGLLTMAPVVSFLQYPIYFIVIVICFYETWGILLVSYQYKFEKDSTNNGAAYIGKNKLVSEVVFTMVLFFPNSLIDLVMFVTPLVTLDQLMIFKSFVLMGYGSAAAYLSYLSFTQHIDHLIDENKFYRLSLWCGLVISIVVGIVLIFV